MFCVCHVFLSIHCSLVVTCWERADLLALLYVKFYCVFVTFPCGILGQVWCLIVSIPDLCFLSYFNIIHQESMHKVNDKNVCMFNLSPSFLITIASIRNHTSFALKKIMIHLR